MKITDSRVNMASSHTSFSQTHEETATIEMRANDKTIGAIMELSSEGELSYLQSMEKYEKEQAEAKKQQEERNWQHTLNALATQQSQVNEANSNLAPSEEDYMITLLKKMLEMLKGGKLSKNDLRYLKGMKALDLRMSKNNNASFKLSTDGQKMEQVIDTASVGRTQVWQKITATSGTHLEYENSKFSTTGMAKTADGRELNFNVEVTLGRSLSQRIDTLTAESYTKILTDPLVINLDTNVTSLSDVKFKFDLDSDGKEEEVSSLGRGSGFLALDKNGDGKINDGSELFGTKSGDGFKDLEAYDEDHNGWIDENDSVYEKLKVWIKDEDGNDKLLSLKEADVGAIYLQNANTEFSFKDASGDLNGMLRKTGIYLKESTGQANTIAHVDLAL